jgi:hypothetical protein
MNYEVASLLPNQVQGIDINWLHNEGREPFNIGGIEFFAYILGRHTLYLPNTEESHALLGSWLIDGKDIQAKLLEPGEKVIYPILDTNVGECVYFMCGLNHKAILEHDPFQSHLSFYFR